MAVLFLGEPAISTDKFQTTQWSLVLLANESDPQDARAALHLLCEHYWKPVYVYLRSRGNAPERAADLTQEFFTRVLEKGRVGDVHPDRGKFRSYLLGAVKHFLSDFSDFESAQKRGGGLGFISIDAVTVDDALLRDTSNTDPDKSFDRKWAMSVLDRGLHRLEEAQSSGKKLKEFQLLKPLIAGGTTDKTYFEIGQALNLKEGSVKSAVHRLRKEYGRLLRDEIRQTLSDEYDADEELNYLLAALAG